MTGLAIAISVVGALVIANAFCIGLAWHCHRVQRPTWKARVVSGTQPPRVTLKKGWLVIPGERDDDALPASWDGRQLAHLEKCRDTLLMEQPVDRDRLRMIEERIRHFKGIGN